MSEIINANEYSSVSQVIKDAIDRSVNRDAIVYIDGYKMRNAIHDDLYEICEGYTDDGYDGYEFWGERLNEDDTISEWRVHLTVCGA